MKIFPKASGSCCAGGVCRSGRLARKWAERACTTRRVFPVCGTAVAPPVSPWIRASIDASCAMRGIVSSAWTWGSMRQRLLSAACYITGNSTPKPSAWPPSFVCRSVGWQCGVSMPRKKTTLIGQNEAPGMAEQGVAADGLPPTLRSGFRQRLKPDVMRSIQRAGTLCERRAPQRAFVSLTIIGNA